MTSCATLLSKNSYPITINTSPTGANVSIIDRNGVEVFKGASPAIVKLKSGNGFFKKARYTVEVSSHGFESAIATVNFKLDGWYFGNLLFGGVIGMLIIDPATGSMYKLEDKYLNLSLSKSTARTVNPSLEIYDIANVPDGLLNKLIKINP